MNYVKAFAGAGLTAMSQPFIFYVETEIPNSEATSAVLDIGKVTVGPSALVSRGTLSQSERRVYDAVISRDETQSGVAGNGKHIGSIAASYVSARKAGAEQFFDPDSSLELLGNTLARWKGADKSINPYNIPRIAVIVSTRSRSGYGAECTVGSVVTDGLSVKRIEIGRGSKCYISTSGKGVVVSAPVKGNSADALTEEMYLDVGRGDAFFSSVALWDPAKTQWELAVRNRHIKTV